MVRVSFAAVAHVSLQLRMSVSTATVTGTAAMLTARQRLLALVTLRGGNALFDFGSADHDGVDAELHSLAATCVTSNHDRQNERQHDTRLKHTHTRAS